jgi:hypothetical protein
LGISGLDPRVLAFSTPNTPPLKPPPGDKKKVGKDKKGHKNHPKKKTPALPIVLAR